MRCVEMIVNGHFFQCLENIPFHVYLCHRAEVKNSVPLVLFCTNSPLHSLFSEQ